MAAETILAFDFGTKRIGVARADSVARIAEPLQVLPNDEALDDRLNELMLRYGPIVLVVGRPRDLEGRSTVATLQAERFAKRLGVFSAPVVLQDEALTSVEAENHRQRFRHASLDEIAATLILEDYLKEH